MKIRRPTIRPINLSKLPPGEVFELEDQLYLKTKSKGHERGSNSSALTFVCVSLESGEITQFFEILVLPVPGTFHSEPST